VKIVPGVRLNFGMRGTSLSLGGKGATVNISERGTRTTVGVPGTGLSYSTFSPRNGRQRNRGTPARPQPSATGGVLLLLVVFVTVAIMAGGGPILIAGCILVALALSFAVLRRYGQNAPTTTAAGGVAPSGAPATALVAPPGAANFVPAPSATASATVAAAFAVSIPTLPAKAARKVTPLLAERRRVEAEPPSGTQASRLTEIDTELARLWADIATSPWRYRD
jgi:hypothetical protein